MVPYHINQTQLHFTMNGGTNILKQFIVSMYIVVHRMPETSPIQRLNLKQTFVEKRLMLKDALVI
jgi:hypothetical protein